jgi:signal transduction histidine kinase/CheY-like chemotaxis protein
MTQFLKSSIKFRTGIAFLLAFGAFIFVQVLSYKNNKNLRDSERQLIDSRLFTFKLSAVPTAIQAYQNHVTSYVLTGNKTFLVDNEKNLSEASANLQDIMNFSSSPERKAMVLRLDSLVNAEIFFYNRALDTYNEKGSSADAITLINSGKGIQISNDIINTSTQIRELNLDNFNQVLNNNRGYSDKVVTIGYYANAFAVIIILISIFTLFSDISKRIKIEQQLRIAQEKAQQSGIMKEQFMANMSHEIRTPMNAIIGFASLLGKSKLDDKQREQLNAIQQSGENLLNIINDILDFSKIEEGMIRIEKIPFSPAALLHSINIMFSQKANDKRIQLEFNSRSELPPAVIGDPTRLTQILANLINNALKFTNEGRISVQTELLKDENEDVTIQFTVKDTGIGIPKDKLTEIFERFTQADTDTTRKYGGSGLGLHIVKRMVELQGGSISVESAEGLGSSFSFLIPYKKASDAVRRETGQQMPARLKTKINILVAEDNILNQELAASLLSQWGFEFDIVKNGKEVIEKLEQKEYDLALMDIQMPEMNGYKTAEYIRQNLHLNLPIIAMTAHVMPGEKDKCISYGMTDYISKPIRENELYSLIAKYTKNVPLNLKEESDKNITGNNSSSHITNLRYLEELFHSNPEMIDKMVQLFLDQNPQEIQKLEQAVKVQDIETIRAIAHKITSNIHFVGLNLVVGDQLSALENLGENKLPFPQIEKLFAEIKEACLKAMQELESMKKLKPEKI